LVAYLRRGNPNLQVFLPDSDDEPARSHVARSLAEFLVKRVQRQTEEGSDRAGMLIASINGIAVADHPLARFLLDAGFHAAPMGFNVRRNLPPLPNHEAHAHA
jgi:ATP-dependent Lhr-like helicase